MVQVAPTSGRTSLNSAVSFAGLWAYRPYLTRPARRLLEAIAWLSALSAALLSEGLPGAVVAPDVKGWGSACQAPQARGTPPAPPAPTTPKTARSRSPSSARIKIVAHGRVAERLGRCFT